MSTTKNIIVIWERTTTQGNKEWNFFYCKTIDQANEFRKMCEAIDGNKVIEITEWGEPI